MFLASFLLNFNLLDIFYLIRFTVTYNAFLIVCYLFVMQQIYKMILQYAYRWIFFTGMCCRICLNMLSRGVLVSHIFAIFM